MRTLGEMVKSWLSIANDAEPADECKSLEVAHDDARYAQHLRGCAADLAPIQEALWALEAKWRQNSKGTSSSNFVKGMDHQAGICAEELLAILGPRPERKGEK